MRQLTDFIVILRERKFYFKEVSLRDMERKDLEFCLNCSIPDISKQEIWIWGAGNTSLLYQEGFKRIENDIKIQGYIDTDPKKIGNTFYGKRVIAPDGIKQNNNICVLISTVREEVIEEIVEHCNRLGMEWHLLDEIVLKKHRLEVLECYDLLEDEHSKLIYSELVKWHLTGKKPKMEIKEQNQYFCMAPFSCNNKEEVFIDCGAFIGDTIEEYIRKKMENSKK